MDNGDIVQVRTYCSHGDQVGVNVRHYVASAKAGTGATLGNLLQTLCTALAPKYLAVLSGNATFEGMDAQVISPVLGMPQGRTDERDEGDVSGASLPLQTAGIITLRTQFGGAGFRGRLYIPFPSEVDNDVGGDPTTPYVTALGELGDQWVMTRAAVGAGGNTNTFTAVLLHRDTGLTTPLSSAVARLKWGTQRRRGKFGRPNTVPL